MDKKFDKFFIKYYAKINSFAVRILLSEQDAEDITQDVFIKLLDIPEIWENNPDEHIGLIYTITRNHIFNFLKRKTLERKYQEQIFQKTSLIDEVGLEKNIYAKELEITALNAIEQMPERRKKIFKMSRYEGKSNQEISEELKISIRTVEHQIYLALSELKKILFLLVF